MDRYFDVNFVFLFQKIDYSACLLIGNIGMKSSFIMVNSFKRLLIRNTRMKRSIVGLISNRIAVFLQFHSYPFKVRNVNRKESYINFHEQKIISFHFTPFLLHRNLLQQTIAERYELSITHAGEIALTYSTSFLQAVRLKQ